MNQNNANYMFFCYIIIWILVNLCDILNVTSILFLMFRLIYYLFSTNMKILLSSGKDHRWLNGNKNGSIQIRISCCSSEYNNFWFIPTRNTLMHMHNCTVHSRAENCNIIIDKSWFIWGVMQLTNNACILLF